MIFAQSRRTTPETNTNPRSFAWGFTRSLFFLFQGKKPTKNPPGFFVFQGKNPPTNPPGHQVIFPNLGHLGWIWMNLASPAFQGWDFPFVHWGWSEDIRPVQEQRAVIDVLTPRIVSKVNFSLSFKGNVCWSVDVSSRKIRKIQKKRTNQIHHFATSKWDYA